MRAAGSIPVYRKEDDPSQMGRNRSMFRAVHEAFAEGSAVGIFPEGISHSFPSLTEVKTGAARIALGGAEHLGQVLPLIPVGIVPEQKDTFRSRMLVVVGDPIDWGDLVGRAEDDRAAVRELTSRIEDGLRGVTINLERWEDRPLVEAAERIWALHHEHDTSAAARVARLEVTTRLLAAVRGSDDEDGQALYTDLRRHLRRLRRLGLRPEQLHLRPDGPRPPGGLLRAYAVGVIAAVPYVLAVLLFFLPYQVTGRLARLARQPEDRVSTYKLMIGIPVYALWVLGIAGLVGWTVGWLWGVVALIVIPAVGVQGSRVRERWREVGHETLLFRRLRHLRSWLGALRDDQRQLAERLQALFQAHEEGGRPGDETPTTP